MKILMKINNKKMILKNKKKQNNQLKKIQIWTVLQKIMIIVIKIMDQIRIKAKTMIAIDH